MRPYPVLSTILWLPAVGALFVAFMPRKAESNIKLVGLVWSLGSFVSSISMFLAFRVGAADFQFVERHEWVKGFGISYRLGVDGISLFLILLTTLLFPICFLAAWEQKTRVKEFVIVLLTTQTAILGVFMSLDLVMFYMFWEAVLIPMYLLIGVWGYERRVYATVKFFLFTLIGGLLMLVAIVALHVKAQGLLGSPTFSYVDLLQVAGQINPSSQRWIFAAFAFAFAIKVPVFGLHTWLPDAHTEAPTVGSVILAGVLLKMGTYGFLRFAIPMFPQVAVQAAPYMVTLAVIGILYGAAVSIVQTDLKRLIAYSSVSHMGFVVLGLFAFTIQAAQGASLQQVNHGLTTGLLFLLVGMLYQRRHTRAIDQFGGLASSAPVMGGVFLLASFASLGLPGLNGFVGEFLILIGSFRTYRFAAVLGAFGVVLGAIYLLWAYQRVFHGPAVREENRVMTDLTMRERLVVVPLVIAIVFIGVWPRPLLDRMEPSITRAYSRVVAP